MYCSKCGENLAEGTLFCPKCGNKVTGDVTNNVSYTIDSFVKSGKSFVESFKLKTIKNYRRNIMLYAGLLCMLYKS
jgi:uncharacterized membrane protein YvbJ